MTFMGISRQWFPEEPLLFEHVHKLRVLLEELLRLPPEARGNPNVEPLRHRLLAFSLAGAFLAYIRDEFIQRGSIAFLVFCIALGNHGIWDDS